MAATFANNAVSTLVSGITAAQTSITVQASDAAEFPSPSGGDWFAITLIENLNMEIVHCTVRTGATLTVTRAREGTAAVAFGAGAKVSHRLTKAALDEFVEDAASDGKLYGRRNAAWGEVTIPAAEPPISAGTVSQYWRGDKSWRTLDKSAVGLGNVDNTSDANKPVSNDTSTALALKEDKANKGVNSGYASLDSTGKVPAAQLPAYVDDVQEYANVGAFPATGSSGILYVALDSNKTYRWSGSGYVEISPSPGSTDSVPEGSTNLYFTPARAAAAAPVQSVNTRTGAVVVTKTDVGLANVDNTSDANKPVSTAQAAADALRVLKAGDTMTGALTLPAGGSTTPSLKFGAATNTGWRGSAGNVIASVSGVDKLDISATQIITSVGILLPADPPFPLYAATKQYVDTKIGDAPSDGKQYGRIDAAWTPIIIGASIGDLPPVSPSVGQFWWESDTGNLFIYYDDLNGPPQWVPANVPVLPEGGSGGGGSGILFSSGVLLDSGPPGTDIGEVGDVYIDTETGIFYGPRAGISTASVFAGSLPNTFTGLGNNYEVGTLFTATKTGYIIGVRWYRQLSESTRTSRNITLWNSVGTNLYRELIGGEPTDANQWVVKTFTTPQPVTVGGSYAVSYDCVSEGVAHSLGFHTAVLTTPTFSFPPNAGCYSATPGAFPGTGTANGYYIEPIFSLTAVPEEGWPEAVDMATQAEVWRRWSGTQAEYDAVAVKDPNTLYVVVG